MSNAHHRLGGTFRLPVDGIYKLGVRHIAGRTLTGADPVVGDVVVLVDEAGTERWEVVRVCYPDPAECPSFARAWIAALLVAPPVTLRLVA